MSTPADRAQRTLEAAETVRRTVHSPQAREARRNQLARLKRQLEHDAQRIDKLPVSITRG